AQPQPADDAHGESREPAKDDEGEGEHGGEAAAPASASLPGLAIADDGLRLQIDRRRFSARRTERFEFRVLGKDGRPVRAFEEEQGRRMHLIVVRRDLRHFQHLHPRQAGDGTWSIDLRLPVGGSYRAFADFQVAGEKHTLGQDLSADGPFQARELPPAADSAEVDGYQVSLTGGSSGDLDFTVRRDGRVVDDLEPYLGARGHLVALREGDLAYLHTHPEDGTLSFGAEYPSTGRYRLFLQFKHEGAVHTAAFTQEATR
nr:hypothetical protein [Solirubrobacterales bacterium]